MNKRKIGFNFAKIKLDFNFAQLGVTCQLGKCQLTKVPIGRSANWGKCQIREVSVLGLTRKNVKNTGIWAHNELEKKSCSGNSTGYGPPTGTSPNWHFPQLALPLTVHRLGDHS